MIGNLKSSPDHWPKRTPENEKDAVLLYLEQLRESFAKNPEILRQLDLIAEKLKKVSDSVLFIVTWIFRSQLTRLQSSSASSTAAIMAATATEFDTTA